MEKIQAEMDKFMTECFSGQKISPVILKMIETRAQEILDEFDYNGEYRIELKSQGFLFSWKVLQDDKNKSCVTA